jgi:hypothetical protein
MSIAS